MTLFDFYKLQQIILRTNVNGCFCPNVGDNASKIFQTCNNGQKLYMYIRYYCWSAVLRKHIHIQKLAFTNNKLAVNQSGHTS